MPRELLIAFYGDIDNVKAGVEVQSDKGSLYVKTEDIIDLLAANLIRVDGLCRAGKASKTDDVAV